MLVRQARPRTVILFDFLAPNLLTSRKASTNASGWAPITAASPQKVKDPRNTLLTKDNHALFLSIQSQLPHVGDVDKREAEQFNRAFAAARRSKDTGSPRKVQEAWNKLLGVEKFEAAVRPTHWKLLSQDLLVMLGRAVGLHGTRQHPPIVHWSPKDMQAARELSLSLVAHGEEATFAMYLVAAVRRDDPEEVLNAFQEYTTMVTFGPVPEDTGSDLPEPELLEHDTEPGLPTLLEWDPVGPDPSSKDGASARLQWDKVVDTGRVARTRILLSILAAHCQRNDLHAAIEAGVTYPVGIDAKSIGIFAQQFMGHTPDGKKTYKDFVHKVIFARLAKYPGLVTSRIASLARAEHVQQLVALYNGMKEGLFGPTIFVALDEKSVSPQRPVLIPPFIWAAFIEAFIKCKVPHHAEELWDDMNRLGVQPPASAWTALINGYGNHRGIAKAYSAWVTMQKLKVKPEPSTYRAIIHALFVDKQDAEAMKLFREFQKEFSGRTDAPGAVAVYNAVVHLLHLMHSDEATAEGILDHMRTHGPKPDLSTYNVFISYHGRRGNFSKLAALTKEMESNDIKPSEFTYSSLLSALLRAGRSNAADMVLNLMLKNGIKPTVAIYTTLMHFQLQEETIHGLNGALALLQKMETDKDPSVRPNVVTYTTLLAAIHKGTWLTADLREEKTSQILQNMSQRGIGFHRITYHILIPACLDNPTEDGLETGMRYYRAMIESGIQVVNDTWYVILRKLHYRRNWEEAEEVVKDMSATFGDKLPPKWLADMNRGRTRYAVSTA